MSIFYFIPIINAISAFVTVYLLCCYLFFKGKIHALVEQEMVKVEKKLLELIDHTDLLPEVAPLIEEKLNGLILSLKQEIPMASLFLTGKLVNRFKVKAETEILKIVPELQQKVSGRLIQQLDFKVIYNNSLDFSKVTVWFLMVAAWAALAGLLFGLVPCLVLLWMN